MTGGSGAWTAYSAVFRGRISASRRTVDDRCYKLSYCAFPDMVRLGMVPPASSLRESIDNWLALDSPQAIFRMCGLGYNCVMTKTILSALAVMLLAAVTPGCAVDDALDYYHTGNAKHEVFSLDRLGIEPLPWPGDMCKTIDDTNPRQIFFRGSRSGD